MTQEDKQLLLKDLCARLPYGVKINHIIYNWEGTCINFNRKLRSFAMEKDNGLCYDVPVEEIRLYLRHMSSMTEKEWKEFSIFTGKTETYVQQIRLDADSMVNLTIGGYKCVYWSLFDKCIDWLNEHHFDYRGLIEKGLALEAPEGIYKAE